MCVPFVLYKVQLGTLASSNFATQMHVFRSKGIPTISHFESTPGIVQQVAHSELQKRADLADQSVLFFLAGANFWEKHAKNC